MATLYTLRELGKMNSEYFCFLVYLVIEYVDHSSSRVVMNSRNIVLENIFTPIGVTLGKSILASGIAVAT